MFFTVWNTERNLFNERVVWISRKKFDRKEKKEREKWTQEGIGWNWPRAESLPRYLLFLHAYKETGTT